MSKVEELEHQLDQAQHALDGAREKKRRWAEVERTKDARLGDLRSSVEEAREERAASRQRLILVRDRVDAVGRHGLSEEEQKHHEHLTARLDALADEHESVTALIHRLLGRIDEADKQHDHAASLARDFGEELDISIAHRKRINEQLKKAKEQHDNPLDSQFFVVAEFDCHDGTPVPEAAYAALKANVHNYLTPLRTSGPKGPVHINSGYRDAAYNATIPGAASNSIHIYDDHPGAAAVDHWQEGRSPQAVQAFHDAETHPDGMGFYTSFTHVDNRGRVGWSDARWNGP